MNIENKVVVVTGAASGIGRALAQAFKNARADKVYIADLNEEGLAETADLMDGIAIKTDVSKESEIRTLIEEVNKENDIDIFCSNAGIGGEFGTPRYHCARMAKYMGYQCYVSYSRS